MRKTKSPILAAVRATTRGLVAAGVLDKATEREFWATRLSVEPTAHAALAARLDAPAQPNDALRRTMQVKAPWDQD